MTDCERFTDGKLLLAEGEGGSDAELARHLAVCEACRADVDEMREVARVWREEAIEPMPEHLRNRILGIRPEARRPALWQRLMPAAAAAILLAALVFPFLRTAPAVVPPPADYPWDAPVVHETPDVAPRVVLPPPRVSKVDAQLRELRRFAEDEKLTVDDW